VAALRSLDGSFETPQDDVDQWRFREVVIGLALGLVLVALVLSYWYATRSPEPGLRWGDDVYISEAQFKEYLEDKGLSYGTWLARHPGAAPWDAS
jgi:hypothetical protein